MGPTRIESLGGKRYIIVMVDDFTKFTSAILLRSKSKAPQQIEILCKRFQNGKGVCINRLQSDHGKEFENSQLEQFSIEVRIAQEFLAPITPQQNGVVELKNLVIQEMVSAIMHNKDVAKYLLGESMNIACHTINKVHFLPRTKKTPYELWKGKKAKCKIFQNIW